MSDDVPRRDGDDDLVDFGPSLRRYLAGEHRALADLPQRERELAERLAPILETARGASSTRRADAPGERAGVPAIEQDPVAIALGLVPGPGDQLDAARFKAARTRRGLDIREVADRLSQRGWAVDVAQVFRWQRGDTEIAPALLSALAEVLGASVAGLRARPRAGTPRLGAWVDDEVIAAFLADWARETDRPVQEVRTRAQQTLAGMNYRNEASVTRDDVLAVLRALRALDQDDGR